MSSHGIIHDNTERGLEMAVELSLVETGVWPRDRKHLARAAQTEFSVFHLKRRS